MKYHGNFLKPQKVVCICQRHTPKLPLPTNTDRDTRFEYFSVLRHPLELIFISPGPQQEQAWTGTSRENLLTHRSDKKNEESLLPVLVDLLCAGTCGAKIVTAATVTVCDSMVFDTVHFEVAVFSCTQIQF